MQPITFAPKYLYRYRSLPKNGDVRRQELAAIKTPYLWCGTFNAMNDPTEGSYELDRDPGKGAAHKRIRDLAYYKKISLGICSFSETNNNGPMWAYYADQFRGICIEYDLQALLASLTNRNDGSLTLVRMTYSEDLYQLSVTATDVETAARQILSFKSHRWIHEREWRLFKGGAGELDIAKNCISHIYVGDKMDTAETSKLKVLLKGIPVSRMELEGYSMSFKRVKA